MQEVARLRVFAWRIREAMKAKAITKAEMARRMNTHRSQLDGLLDPQIDHVELATLARAANAVGYKLSLDLITRHAAGISQPCRVMRPTGSARVASREARLGIRHREGLRL